MRPPLATLSAALLVALLCAPTAAAWVATMRASPLDASLRDSLLVAGALRATGSDGEFGAPVADRLSFDAPVSVLYCPDQSGQPQEEGSCAGRGETTTGARLYVWSGGLVARAPASTMRLQALATAGALSGTNVTLNQMAVNAGLFVGGNATVEIEGSSLQVRPLDRTASIEVRGDQGFRTYNGTAYTLYISAFSRATLEAHGAFLGAGDVDVTLSRAGIVPAERELRVVDLYTMLYALQPPETADRRAALPGAFGPFQFVPALLDGAVAKRQNLTLNEGFREGFTFVRVSDARFSFAEGNWTGSGNATYMVQEQLISPDPADTAKFPLLVTVFLVAGAVMARAVTKRVAPTKRRRVLGHALRAGGLLLLVLLAASTLAPLLGFSPLLDMGDLTVRSRTQLALLVTGIVATAYIAVGLPSESLARSAFSWRKRPGAILLPALVGLLAAAIFILLATPILLTFVARFVRL